MVTLLEHNYITHYSTFHIDCAEDLALLPKQKINGELEQFWCCAGSRAECQDGTTYMLNGTTNEWEMYTDVKLTDISDEEILAVVNRTDAELKMVTDVTKLSNEDIMSIFDDEENEESGGNENGTV